MSSEQRIAFFHVHVEECDPLCVLESFGKDWRIEPAESRPTAVEPEAPTWEPHFHGDLGGEVCVEEHTDPEVARLAVEPEGLPLDVGMVADTFRMMASVASNYDARIDSGDLGLTPLIRPSELAAEFIEVYTALTEALTPTPAPPEARE